MRLRHLIKIAAFSVGIAALVSLLLLYRWRALDAQSVVAIAIAVLCASLAIAAFTAWFWLFQARALSTVRKWAAANGYNVLRYESAFNSGAFSFWSTYFQQQMVFSVTMQDCTGCERKAWVRCGGFPSGVFNDQIEVKWQDEPKNA